jgi:CheY-like chemotaxis protein
MKREEMNILVIDDDPDYLLQQELVLKSAGYSVETAGSAAAGEARIREGGMDMVILDLMMERNDDGFRLCYVAKRLEKDRPVIMVTAVAEETGIEFDAATKEERAWIKADALLAKPVRPEQLLDTVARHLEK